MKKILAIALLMFGCGTNSPPPGMKYNYERAMCHEGAWQMYNGGKGGSREELGKVLEACDARNPAWVPKEEGDK